MSIYNYGIARLTGATSITGTADFTSGISSVLGTGTAFTTELAVGDVLISFGGNVYAVALIPDNTHLTLQSNAVASESGVPMTKIAMTNIETMSTPASPPKGEFQVYYEGKDTGDGLLRGFGRPLATWSWSYRR